ncbi:MFS transporter [Hoeflea sp. WL0058]|uniref:MFS transporter n=1 Tax=Flavimaribacter sediminis TaxID=2865987 RepID=A0AAE2ZS07_9HYPH|nr:MFS transporter [Flavimaribacter sediminis]MBW8639822.1 MFS transporter [Flavimaribacter sediminis]
MAAQENIQEQPYGWVIVAVATLSLALGFGANLSVTVLIDPFQTEFGWSRAEISMAYTMVTVGAAFGGLVWGSLSDRIGARQIAILASVTLAGAVAAVGYQSNLYAIYLLYLLIGGVGFAGLFTPLLALTGLWFSRRKGMAIGIATAGGALGQGLVPYVARYMISTWDWRTAMLALGVCYLVLLLPAMFLLRPPPVLVQSGAQVRKSNDNLWGMPHTITIPWLSIAGVFCCICMAAPLMHLVPLGTDLGLSPQTAAGLLLALMASGVVGRILFGTIADRVGGLRAYFVASIGQTASVFWFTQTASLPLLYLLSIVFGFFFSGVMTCLLICAREAAPLRITGFAVAIVGMAGWLGMGIGGFQAGYFYDQLGTYSYSYAYAAAAGVINLVIVAILLWYRSARSGMPEPAGA